LAINRAIAGWLEAGGGRNIAVLWVTGRGTHEEFARFDRPPAVQVIDFLDPMADGYSVADLVVSRAGMITVAELCAWGLPSILVPLPTAAADHQTYNARVLAEAGAAFMLAQKELTPVTLGELIDRLLNDRAIHSGMAAHALARGRPAAADEIVSNFSTLFR
jgi:UDP-N-acetylglucosamine--N-acetylmuramyl-(pentapeptide) pyrophosphoryl-undecaprenol N-acetylglucosamine transferase